MPHKPRWLDRKIAMDGPYLCLCLSEQEFLAAFKHLKCRRDIPAQWCPPGAGCTHHLEGPDGVSSIVCADIPDDVTGPEIAALLVHEAVHVWQSYCEFIGEKNPGSEQEAYGIQNISLVLMAEYARRVSNG